MNPLEQEGVSDPALENTRGQGPIPTPAVGTPWLLTVSEGEFRGSVHG